MQIYFNRITSGDTNNQFPMHPINYYVQSSTAVLLHSMICCKNIRWLKSALALLFDPLLNTALICADNLQVLLLAGRLYSGCRLLTIGRRCQLRHDGLFIALVFRTFNVRTLAWLKGCGGQYCAAAKNKLSVAI